MTRGLPNPLILGGRLPLILGLGGFAALAIGGFLAPQAILRGWLIAFSTIGGIVLGAIALLAIHGLTGGRWGDIARPALASAALAVPLLLVMWLPLLLADSVIYPWVSNPGTTGAGVARGYLNTGFFALRGLAFLGGLSLFALIAQRRPLGAVAAALCLVLYALGMNLSAFDWLLSLDPRFNSSAFGVQMIVTQLIGALAFVILVTDAPSGDKAWADFGALLLATLLGLLYLVFMTFLIYWYGDLPDQASWYLARSRHGWLALEIAGLLIGNILPAIALLFARIRRTPAFLRLVAWAALGGVLVENIWLVAPATGGGTAAAGCAASLVAAGLTAGLVQRANGPPRPALWSPADGC